MPSTVIPAKAGIQYARSLSTEYWLLEILDHSSAFADDDSAGHRLAWKNSLSSAAEKLSPTAE